MNNLGGAIVRHFFLSVLLILGVIAVGCDKKVIEDAFFQNELQRISAEKLEKLRAKKILFGHQSVGLNILEGIKLLDGIDGNIKLNVVKLGNVEDLAKPFFAHFAVGENCDPISKIDGFKKEVGNGLGEQIDIAFFKFCYIDFNEKTDIEKIFLAYVKMVDELETRYPQVTFVHVTVPLISVELGIKDIVKKILGRSGKIGGNIARNTFNEMLLAKYNNKRPVFDLAKFESLSHDGNNDVTFVKGGKVYRALNPEFTFDN